MAEAQKGASVSVLAETFCACAPQLRCHPARGTETDPEPGATRATAAGSRSGSAVPPGSGGTRPPQVGHHVTIHHDNAL